MNKNIKIVLLGFIFLIVMSGCLQLLEEKRQPQSTPEATVVPTTAQPTEPPATEVPTPAATPEKIPTPVVTPAPTLQELPSGAIFVSARMLKPTYWGPERYELESLKAEIHNQRNIPLSIKAQIKSGQQVLEEKSFNLPNEGSVYTLVNENKHFINNTNVTMQLSIQGYKPLIYQFTQVDTLS